MSASTERSWHSLEKKSGNFLTRSRPFKKLTKWAFEIMDANHTGSINKTELYAGFLLVHLNLAKYAGPAACYPPPRSAVDELFEASDDDSSGDIDKEEFQQIMVILCSQVTSRIAVYYGILILLAPYLAKWTLQTLDFIGVDDIFLGVDKLFISYAPTFLVSLVGLIPDSLWSTAPEQIMSLLLFFLVIPILFNQIDQHSRSVAERNVVFREAITEDPLVSDEKKDE